MKKEVKKRKTKQKKIDKSGIVLWIILGVLCLIVIGLFFQVSYVKKEEEKHPRANMSIPITKKEDTAEFHITTLSLSKERGYVFKLTNFSSEQVNEEEIPYQIVLENSSDSTISIEKLNSDQKWTLKDELMIDGETLKKEEKEEVFYRVKVITSKELKVKDLITVRIHS